MRIHFMVNGMGLGHVYRDLLMMKELAKRHRVAASSFGSALEVVRENGFENAVELPTIGELVLDKDKVNIKMSLWENLKRLKPVAIKRISNILVRERPDVVVVDGYPLGIIAAKMLSIKTANITNCTKVSYVFPKQHAFVERGADVLSMSIIEMSDLVIVPDFAPPFTVARENIAYFGLKSKFHYVGPLSLAKPARKSNCVLISVGGSGVHGASVESAREAIEKMGYKTITSDGKLSHEKTQEALAQAPFAILHGGHTTIMDAICAGTPIIAIPMNDYTERINNAAGAEKLGIGITLDEEWISKDNIEIAVARIKDKGIRENISNLSRIARKMKGYEKAARLIESIKHN